jgi:hypothetical protein
MARRLPYNTEAGPMLDTQKRERPEGYHITQRQARRLPYNTEAGPRLDTEKEKGQKVTI